MIGIVAFFPVISIVFYGAVPVGINYRYFENCEECGIEYSEMSGMSWISYGHQWIVMILLMTVVLIIIFIGIIFGIKIWRKRK
ncbi:MAG: hypothetical protein ACE5DU_02545 [Nitrosopumilus sp.]